MLCRAHLFAVLLATVVTLSVTPLNPGGVHLVATWMFVASGGAGTATYLFQRLGRRPTLRR